MCLVANVSGSKCYRLNGSKGYLQGFTPQVTFRTLIFTSFNDQHLYSFMPLLITPLIPSFWSLARLGTIPPASSPFSTEPIAQVGGAERVKGDSFRVPGYMFNSKAAALVLRHIIKNRFLWRLLLSLATIKHELLSESQEIINRKGLCESVGYHLFCRTMR